MYRCRERETDTKGKGTKMAPTILTQEDIEATAKWLQTSQAKANKKRVRLDGWYIRLSDGPGSPALVAQLSHKGPGDERTQWTVDCALAGGTVKFARVK